MRLQIVTQYYFPQPLANAETVGGLARGLALRGHQVDVVTPAAGGREPHGLTVHRAVGYFPKDRASVPKRLTEYLVFSVGALWAGARAPRPDALIVPSPPPTLGAIGLLLGWWHRRPVLYVVQDLYPEVALAAGAVAPGVALRLLGGLMRLVYRKSAVVVVIDEAIVTTIEATEPRAKVRAVRNGIDLAPFHNATRDDRWLESLGVDPLRPVVMYAGNVGRSQDLAAVAQASAACGAQLIVHGGGAALESLRASSRAAGWDHVVFSGYVDRERLGSVFASADLHVVPLKADVSAASVPSKLLSITAAGRPALVAAEPDSAAARLLAESGAGWLVPPGRPEVMTEVMATALADRAELDRRGAAGHAWAEVNAGNDRCAAGYEDVLRAVIPAGQDLRA
jgi:colanic acid biosynthesis glycosyl transferase WcaI